MTGLAVGAILFAASVAVLLWAVLEMAARVDAAIEDAAQGKEKE